jgi:hypothetical protein
VFSNAKNESFVEGILYFSVFLSMAIFATHSMSSYKWFPLEYLINDGKEYILRYDNHHNNTQHNDTSHIMVNIMLI